MTTVIGVRFRTAGKIYFFSPGELEIKRGDHVIVETARGIEYGTVVAPPYEVEDEKVVKPIKDVMRLANEVDEAQEKSNREKEKDAFKVCQEKIRKHGLVMKLIDAEYTFDNNKILFYFTADGRIDFRALVKDLAAVFRTRIELRQIGVRDETKIIGGYGICGRPLCCHSYLSDFAPVSIKMAKEQSMSLNPTKISGVCGRLMCCLKNEEDVYEELNKKLPKVGDIVSTDDGLEGEVSNVGVLRQTVRILVDVNDEKEVHDYTADQVHFLRKKAKHRNGRPEKSEDDEESAELKALEDMGTTDNLEEGAAAQQNRGNRNGNNRPNNRRGNFDRRDRRNGDNADGNRSGGNGTDAGRDRGNGSDAGRDRNNGSGADGQNGRERYNSNHENHRPQNNRGNNNNRHGNRSFARPDGRNDSRTENRAERTSDGQRESGKEGSFARQDANRTDSHSENESGNN